MDGAVSYTITFDPMTKTEANHDFVRFCEVRILVKRLLFTFSELLHVLLFDLVCLS